MKKPAPGVWGIDLGQCALKALRLQEIDGQLTATAFDYVEYPKILNQPDADADQLMREALEQFLSRNSLRGDVVSIAVPGQSGLARFVKLPPVEEKKIADIVKFEAKQQIPFNLDEVVWDYQKLGAGEVVDGFAMETEVGLFAMKRDLINRFMQHFKDVGVEVHVIQMAPLALCNYIGYELLGKDVGTPTEGKGACVVGLDIGTDSSTLVITDGGRIIWQRAVALGGNHFTRALTKDLKLTFAKAEHLKRNATKSGAADLKKILGALKPVLNDFVGEVQRSLGYFTNTHRDAQIEYMVGLGNAFRLPGLQRFLSEKLQLEVRKIDKMARLGGDEVLAAPIFQDNILSFGVAYGLALQGLARGRLVTNLLPGEIRLERLIRSKKPWAVAAAGVLLLALGATALGNYLDERPYTAKPVIEAMEVAKSAASAAAKQEKDFADAKAAALKEEEAVKSIVAGQDERLNWIALTKFVSDCVPQPDGTNVPPEYRTRYWLQKPVRKAGVNMSGEEAFKEYQRRLSEGGKPSKDDKDANALPLGIDDLIQLSVESVDARFCDDLPTFWKAATKGREEGHVRPLDHHKRVLPEGKGWVVEVAGYTYHHNKENFVIDTLLNNIARRAVKLDPKGAKPGAPGTASAPAPAPAPAPDAAADPAKEKEKESKEPVVGRVSHVLLLKASDKAAAEAANFEIIQQGHLDALVGGGRGGPGAGGGLGGKMMPGMGSPIPGGGMTGSPMPGGGGMEGGVPGTGAAAAAPNRGGWVSASTRSGGASASGSVEGRAGGIGMTRPGETARPPQTPTGGNPDALGHTRTEFVILFIWKEPTPSDALRDSGPAADPAAAAPGGAK